MVQILTEKYGRSRRNYDEHIFDDFDVDSIVTKAVPDAVTRIKTLEEKGYKLLTDHSIVSYDDYYIKTR